METQDEKLDGPPRKKSLWMEKYHNELDYNTNNQMTVIEFVEVHSENDIHSARRNETSVNHKTGKDFIWKIFMSKPFTILLSNFVREQINKCLISPGDFVNMVDLEDVMNVLEETDSDTIMRLFRDSLIERFSTPEIKNISGPNVLGMEKWFIPRTKQYFHQDHDYAITSSSNIFRNTQAHNSDIRLPITSLPKIVGDDLDQIQEKSVKFQPISISKGNRCLITQEVLDNVRTEIAVSGVNLMSSENQLNWKEMRKWIEKLFIRLFTIEEITEGTLSGRSYKKYDPVKIFAIATFLGWVKSKPNSFTIENFKNYEENATKDMRSGLNEMEMEHFRKVIQHYSWTLRNKRKETKLGLSPESKVIKKQETPNSIKNSVD